MSTPLPDKKFFKIGEVAALVGVKAHVLRYWESELGVLRPLKTRGAHRMYRREDVEILGEVRKLLQEDGLTLAAAKRRFAKVLAPAAEDASAPAAEDASAPAAQNARAFAAHEAPVSTASRALALRAELIQVRNDLATLLAQLDAPPAPPPSANVATATVTAVVPKTILMQRSSDLRRPR